MLPPNTRETPAADPQMSVAAPQVRPSLWAALRYWWWLGWVSFGGPAGPLALMHRDLVVRRRWVEERRFLHALNYTMVLPGPEAQQLATYIGWMLHGVRGALIAGTLFILPGLLLLILAAAAYVTYGETPAVQALLYGIQPAIVAVVVHAAWRIGRRSLTDAFAIAVAVAAFVAIAGFGVLLPWVVAGAILVGVARALLAREANVAPDAGEYGSRLPPDAAKPPSRRVWTPLAVALAAGLATWAFALALLIVAFGWHGVLTQMALFFTKAALVSFGGAYAVLPFVVQGAVEAQGWLSMGAMIDALALGESTPGPLILVASFVGFLGAYAAAPFGLEAPMLAGVAGALIVTFFLFLPSFVFVLAGAPLVERSASIAWIARPLAAVTAAVVGVIASLAVFFATHLFWPEAGGVDLGAVGLALLAGAALFSHRSGVVPVIAASGVLGALLYASAGPVVV